MEWHTEVSECPIIKAWAHIYHFPLHDIHLAVSLVLLLIPYITFMSACSVFQKICKLSERQDLFHLF